MSCIYEIYMLSLIEQVFFFIYTPPRSLKIILPPIILFPIDFPFIPHWSPLFYFEREVYEEEPFMVLFLQEESLCKRKYFRRKSDRDSRTSVVESPWKHLTAPCSRTTHNQAHRFRLGSLHIYILCSNTMMERYNLRNSDFKLLRGWVKDDFKIIFH